MNIMIFVFSDLYLQNTNALSGGAIVIISSIYLEEMKLLLR